MANLDQYYRILGLEPGASPKKVKQAYRDLLWVWHPDRFEGNPRLQDVAQEKLKDINNAYEQLKSATTSSYGGEREEQRNNQREASEDRKKSREQSASKPPPEQDVTAKSKSIRRYLALGFLLFVFLSSFYRQLFRPALNPTKLPQVITDSPPPMSGGEPSVPTNTPTTNHPNSSTSRSFSSPHKRLDARPDIPRPPAEREEPIEKGYRGVPRDKAPTGVDAGLARLREEIIGKMRESRAAAEKLLAIHEEEKNKLTIEYQRRREFYSQGLILRSELSQVERALAEATVRVEEDKRWLTESYIAITEAAKRDELLRASKSP
jgi:curved DNA-binding protein CbpA